MNYVIAKWPNEWISHFFNLADNAYRTLVVLYGFCGTGWVSHGRYCNVTGFLWYWRGSSWTVLQCYRFIMFNQYRIPRENLLNRTADVTEDGRYESSFSEPSRILGAVLENLSAGKNTLYSLLLLVLLLLVVCTPITELCRLLHLSTSTFTTTTTRITENKTPRSLNKL